MANFLEVLDHVVKLVRAPVHTVQFQVAQMFIFQAKDAPSEALPPNHSHNLLVSVQDGRHVLRSQIYLLHFF